MIAYVRERRRFRRIFFTIEHGITCIITPSGLSEKPITASIMNLSEDGVGLAINKDKEQGLFAGDRLILERVQGIRRLDFITKMEMEIKWVLDNKALAHIAFGCGFIHTPQAIRERIRIFINSWDMDKQE